MKQYLSLILISICICTQGQSVWEEESDILSNNFAFNRMDFSNGKIYAFGNWSEGFDTEGRLYVTNNLGQNWDQIPLEGIPFVYSGGAMLCSDGILYLAGNRDPLYFDFSVFRSIDNGQSWEEINHGLSPDFAINDFMMINNELFALGNYCEGGTSEARIYKSLDNGDSWVQIQTSGLDNLTNGSALGYIDGVLILAGYKYASNEFSVYRCTDFGISWEESSSGLPLMFGLNDFAEYHETFYAVGTRTINSHTSGELYESNDFGISWSKVETSGLENLISGSSMLAMDDKMLLSGFTSLSPFYHPIFTSVIENPMISTIELSGDLSFLQVLINSLHVQNLMITNSGNIDLTITSITYPEGFSGNWDSGAISAGGSQEVEVTFAPSEAKEYSGLITINSDATSGENTIAVSGVGVSGPNALDEDTANKLLKLYPNPAQDKVCVEVEKELVGKDYRITDHTGRTLLNGKLAREKNTISFESFSNGVYFLVVDGECGLARKLVKQ